MSMWETYVVVVVFLFFSYLIFLRIYIYTGGWVMARVVTMLMPSGFLLRQCLGSLFFNFFCFRLVLEASKWKKRETTFHTEDRRKLEKAKERGWYERWCFMQLFGSIEIMFYSSNCLFLHDRFFFSFGFVRFGRLCVLLVWVFHWFLFLSLTSDRRHYAKRIRKETVPAPGSLPAQTTNVVQCFIDHHDHHRR